MVDDALRQGQSRLDEPAPTERFRTRTVSVGRVRLNNLDDVSSALDFAEQPPRLRAAGGQSGRTRWTRI